MKVAIIAAVAENGVIGRGNALPWRLSADLRRFKELTMGRAIIMGRRTYESIGRPLPGRQMIVVTRQPDWHVEGGETAVDLERAYVQAAERGEGEAMVVGGAELYRQALPHADRLYLTRVHAAPTGDVRFPAFDASDWRLHYRESHPADEKNEYPFSFELYDRVDR